MQIFMGLAQKQMSLTKIFKGEKGERVNPLCA
jgi:hypothetical protein